MNQEAPKRIASPFQKDIWHDMVHGTWNLVVRAVAGSGKSTTILYGVGLIPKNLDVLLLAFNKDIAAENTSKLPKDSYNVTSKTLHGQGSTAMRYNFESNLNPDKYRTLIRTLMPYWNLPAEVNADDYRMRVLKLADLARLSLLTTVEEVEALAEEHDVAIINGEASKALQLIEQGSKNTAEIDYTDMIYLPVRLKVRVKKFDVVLVDECQDLSRCQREFMLMHIKPGGKFIAVGDVRQCQPVGTKVNLAGGGVINIEDLKAGNRVVAYNSKDRGSFNGVSYFGTSSYTKGREVTAIASREYNGDLISLESNNKISRYTPDHICIAKFDELACQGKYVVYLMRQGNRFRIGMTPMFQRNGFGATRRLTCEHGESMWILKVCSSRTEAIAEETFLSIKYGIPEIVFRGRTSGNTFKFTQNQVDNFFNRFEHGELTTNAKRLLKDFYLRLDLPFYSKTDLIGGKQKVGGRSSSFLVYACNLMSGYMRVGHLDQNSWETSTSGNKPSHSCKPIWKLIDSITREPYKGLVYSMNVDVDHNYVGDGILTSNCIYGFAGADADSYEALCAIPNTKQLPLSVTYRCSKAVVRRAQEIVPDIQAAEHAVEGEENEEALLTDVRDRDMVLCRNTFPLVKVCMSYLVRGIKATVQGKDIGTGLINMVKNTNCNNVPQMLAALGKDLQRTREKVMKKRSLSPAEVDEDPTYAAHKERIDVIELFAKNTGSIADIIAHINSIFADKAKEGIRLSTIHRSKGLEADRVFILSPDLIPAKYARKNPKMLLQEMNLKYVAITRAKSYLGWIEYDAYGKKKRDEENDDRAIRGASKRGKNVIDFNENTED